VLVSQEARLFRDRTEIQVNRFIELVARQGGWVICGIGNARIYNFPREMDRELFRMACKYGRQYIEYHIKRRLHPAIQRTAMAGRYSGGTVPWGYVVDYDSHSSSCTRFAPCDPHAKLVTDHVFQVFAAMPFPSVVEVARHWGSLGLIWPFFGAEIDPRRVRLVEWHCTRNEARGGYEFHFQQAPRICHAPLVEDELFWWCYDQLLDGRPSWAPPRRAQVAQTYRPRHARQRHPEQISFLVPGHLRCVQHGNIMGVMLYPDDKPYLRCHGNDRLRLKEDTCSAMLATSVEQAVAETFLAQRTLDEEDVRNLAHLAAQQTSAHVDAQDTLQRELAEQQQRYARAKRLALAAGDKALANDFFAEAREARKTIVELEQHLASQAQRTDAPSQAWAKAEWMATIAECIRSTFLEWPQAAQTRVLMLALYEGFLGRIDRRRMGLLLLWQGGPESRQDFVSGVRLLAAWSEEQEQALRMHFHQLTWEALLRMFPHRTKDAIKQEASRLGLRRTRHELSAAEPYILAQPEPTNVMEPYGFPLEVVIQAAAGGVVTAELSVVAPRHSSRNCS
jgi:hypothetical protein